MGAKTHLKAFMTAGVLTCAANVANAGFIQANTATASSEFNSSSFDGQAVNTINGSGLPLSFDETSTHADYASGNHWTTASGTAPLDASILWGFTTAQDLYGMYIWNHLSTAPPASNGGYEPILVDLILRDSSNNHIFSLINFALSPDNNTAQTVDFGGQITNVSTVELQVLQTQSSSSFTGLAEVGFETEALPSITVTTPGPLALLFLLGAGHMIARTMQRHKK